MLPHKDFEKYPRKLTEQEKTYLRLLLPEDRKGYKVYRDKLDDLFVIGKGRFEQDDYVLGNENDKPDFSIPAEQMLTMGKIETRTHQIDISIHEESEEKIELDFAVEGEETFDPEILNYWTLSEWLPGKKSPVDNSTVREIHLIKNKVVVAIAPESKKLWVYEAETGINHLIPQTNFYNEIMRVKNERDPKIAIDVKRLFSNHDELSDVEIVQGFLMYNKYLNKIKIDYSLFTPDEKSKKKKSFLNIFGGKKN
ncbi:MAG: hypothetical protein U5K00_11700 [Melioribacteraceae bacterium]|nr:hypothetical protein [Melioribacteraceae bacterium]